jgi:hypothetical protein
MPSEFRSRFGKGTFLTLVVASLHAACGNDPSNPPGGGGTTNPPPSTTTPGGTTGGTGGTGGGTSGSAGTGGATRPLDARPPDGRRPDAAAGRDGPGRDTPAAPPPSGDAGGARDGTASPGAPGSGPNGPGNAALGARCTGANGEPGGCQAGLICCQPCCEGRQPVCTRPVQNAAGIGIGMCPLPDLVVSLRALEDNIGAGPMTFAANQCEAREGCVNAPGTRNTLHFEVFTPNLGTADLILGTPAGKPGFEFATCHEHYHFNNYALYQLLDMQGNEVLKGLKRAFCLMDTDPVAGYPLARPNNARYNCGRQGIQRGWGDSYYNGLECQFLDVTDVKPGRYKLRVTINPNRFFPELSYDNNVGEVEVDIAPMVTSPTEPCTGLIIGPKRECGWQRAMTATCTPGSRVIVSCGAECGGGRRTGDPMMRVCPGNEPCRFTQANSNDDCGEEDDNALGARVQFNCPAGGRYTVLTASSINGRPATCDVAVR